MSKPIIIIDFSYWIHYAKYGLTGLSYGEKKTGVTFWFLKKILSLSDKFKTNQFVFALDSRKSKRREIYPGYKGKRNEAEKTDEEIENTNLAFEQGDELRDRILPYLGFENIFMEEFFEGDDIVGSCVLNNEGKFVVAASDNDLYQLLSDDVSMFDIKKNKLFTAKDFEKKFDILPKQWYDIKCVAGCSGDSVPGIPGVKEPTAIKYLKGELPSHYKVFQKIESPEGLKTRELTSRLVKAPFEGTPEIVLDFDEKFDTNSFINICDRYNLQSFVKGKEFDIWKNNFCGGG